jgi:ABC-type glycerol-3-phosphate transport system substrate-binding protein
MMKVFGLSLAIAALLAAGLGAASAAFADTAQEVYICKLNEGKTMADLKKVIADFKQMIGKLKGGDKYQAWLLTPVAANDLADIVWVGQMPDGTALATLNAEYVTSEAGQAQDQKFRSVMTCKSRSIWNSEKLK